MTADEKAADGNTAHGNVAREPAAHEPAAHEPATHEPTVETAAARGTAAPEPPNGDTATHGDTTTHASATTAREAGTPAAAVHRAAVRGAADPATAVRGAADPAAAVRGAADPAAAERRADDPPTADRPSDGIRGTAHGTAPVPLSVLDLVTVGSGSTATDALRAGVDLARLAEARGFHRYWVAEHHSMPGVASSSPAVILAHLAAHTERIRLGSGGVMLPNHAPLVIAEQFGTLEALAPGRVDLGLGRAPGTDGATAAALRRTDRLHEGADDFPEQLAELTRFLDDDFPDGHPYRRIHAVPGPVQATSPGGVQSRHRPPVWLLGSSGFSARLAALLGLPFAFAHHFSAQNTVPALDLYREHFRPSAVLDEPYALIGVSVLAADDEREARRQVLATGVNMLRLRTGRPGLFPSPEEAEAYAFSPLEREFVDSWTANIVHGTADEVRSGLDDLHKRTGADELMLTSHAHRGALRLRSYELVADAYGLPTA